MFKEDGAEEKSAVQVHDYTYTPQKAIYIISKEDQDTKKLIYENGNLSELINEEPNSDISEEALNNKLQMLYFVLKI